MAVILLPCLLLAASMVAADAESTSACPDSCGGMSIEYPFSIGAGCFRKGFEIVCDGGGARLVLAGATALIPVSHLSLLENTPWEPVGNTLRHRFSNRFFPNRDQ